MHVSVRGPDPPTSPWLAPALLPAARAAPPGCTSSSEDFDHSRPAGATVTASLSVTADPCLFTGLLYFTVYVFCGCDGCLLLHGAFSTCGSRAILWLHPQASRCGGLLLLQGSGSRLRAFNSCLLWALLPASGIFGPDQPSESYCCWAVHNAAPEAPFSTCSLPSAGGTTMKLAGRSHRQRPSSGRRRTNLFSIFRLEIPGQRSWRATIMGSQESV